MKNLPLEPNEWRDRCARRISELDRQITDDEARTVAQDFYDFERTRAMNPEAAAEFVASEMSRPDHPRFERRSGDRPQRAPILTSIFRLLTSTGKPNAADDRGMR